jgi:hypothetical protein
MTLSTEDFEDYVLANVAEFVSSMREADETLREGQTRLATEVFEELEEL